MRKCSSIIFFALIVRTLLGEDVALAQTAYPFLLRPVSPEANGMAGINASRLSQDPVAVLANPAQPAIQGLGQLASTGFVLGGAPWFQPRDNVFGFDRQSDLTLHALAFNSSVDLRRTLSVPFPLEISISYSRLAMRIGENIISGGETPLGPDTLASDEHSDNFTFGVGIDYGVRIGLGYTYKSLHYDLEEFYVQNQRMQAKIENDAFDAGAMVDAPLFELYSRIAGQEPLRILSFTPAADLVAGYALSNLGMGSVRITSAGVTAPLPRTATLGLSLRVGISSQVKAVSWELVSVTFAREASTLLIAFKPELLDSLGGKVIQPAGWEYTGAAGGINFLHNILLGEGGGVTDLRKGWEVTIGEFLSLRGGLWHTERSTLSTGGVSVHLGGILKCMRSVFPEMNDGGILPFVGQHVELSYVHSSISTSDTLSAVTSTSFSGIQIIVR